MVFPFGLVKDGTGRHQTSENEKTDALSFSLSASFLFQGLFLRSVLKFWRMMRKIAAHQITASDMNTFTNTFLINMRMKLAMTTSTKSGDELISLKETFGLCAGGKDNSTTST